MKLRPLAIAGAWEITPVLHDDPRGLFAEWFRLDHLAAEIGQPMRVAQANLSVSARGVVRGIHYADVPPGQAKYVTCLHGAVLDVVVDLRLGSPTFALCDSVRLDDVERRAVYIGEGLGHAFCALTEHATVTYLCSQTYDPRAERAVHPLDKEIGIRWPVDVPRLSARDAAARTLGQSRDAGLLPELAACPTWR